MSNTHAIQVERVTVSYGRRRAVDGVTMSVPSGSVYALLGRNGAGKSTLVRAILGQLKPDHGRTLLFGVDAWSERKALMERIGVVPEESDASPTLRVADAGKFHSRVYRRWNQQSFDARLERFGIRHAARFGELSKGQKKQVSLALALSTEAELLVLDDPTLGLDVVARKSLFDEVIADMADRGISVFITTHDLVAIESIADHVAILHDGRLVLEEELERVKARFRKIRFRASAQPVPESLILSSSVRQWGSGTEAVVSDYDERKFDSSIHDSQSAEVSPLSLEEIFIAVAGEQKGAVS